MIKPVPNYGASIAIAAAGLPQASDPLETRARIAQMKADMLASPNAVDLPFTESLKDGLYTRVLFVPKGCRIVGKIHRQPCVNIVAKGDISIATETGAMRVQAGYTVTTPAGIQKVGYAHEDTIFINVFRTDETDIAKIEALLVADDYEALECAKEPVWPGLPQQ